MSDDLKDRYTDHWWRVWTEFLGIPAELIDGQYHPDIPSPCCGAKGTFNAIAGEYGISCRCTNCGGPKGTGGILTDYDLTAKILGVSRDDAIRRIDDFLGFQPRVDLTSPDAIAAAIADVDLDWRLIPVDGNKRPVDPATGKPQANWAAFTYDSEGITDLIRRSRYVGAIGLVLGPISGVMAVDFDGDDAEATFLSIYGRPSSDLPASVSWSSGRPNRRQVAYRVPQEHHPHLRGRRHWPTTGHAALELRWAGHQSVIAGTHPDTAGYHWLNPPTTTAVADAPDWLLEPLFIAPNESLNADYQPTAGDADRATEILQHINPRDDYDAWLRIGMALHSVDAGLLNAWVEWSSGCSNFNESECLDKWQSFKKSGITIGTLYYFARQDGWKPQDATEQSIPGRITLPDFPPVAVGQGRNQEDDQSLDTNNKRQRRRTLAPDEVKLLIPDRIGGMPRLNIRTNNFHAGSNIYSADDISRIYVHLSNETERWPKEITSDTVVELARNSAYDPVQEELSKLAKSVEPLPLDDWGRLDQLLLGINDPIAASFLPQFFISAVARVFRPGCGVRRTPVLIGPQWRGKTRLGRILFGKDHWIENVSDLGKDDLMRLQSGWGIELSELNGITRRKDQEALKAFLTASDDVFRIPYGKGVARYERRCVFWGTSNGPPLRDLSGSTRFVCIQIPDRMLPLQWAEQYRDALWARAVIEYRAIPLDQESWDHSDEAERNAIQDRNANHQEIDPWADSVAAILADATDRPISIPYVLDRLEIPMSQRNNATAARVRQLGEAAGWVVERRRALGSNTKRQGFWPAEPPQPVSENLQDNDTVVGTPATPNSAVGTPRGAQENSSPPLRSTTAGHPGHPDLTEVEKNEVMEENAPPVAPENQKGTLGTFGVAGLPNSSKPSSASESGWAPRNDAGVPGVPSENSDDDLLSNDLYGEFDD